MTPERWSRVKEVFQKAACLPPLERAPFLAQTCEDDALRREVKRLLDLDLENEQEDQGDQGNKPFLLDQPAVSDGFRLLAPVEESAIPLEDSMEGRPIGPYVLCEEIGRGGMGVVYRATREDGQFHRQVAIKLVQRGMRSGDTYSRFRLEQKILGQLEHPFIAQIIDGGLTEDQRPFLVMEHVEGEAIDAFCRHRDLSIRQRMELLRKVCAAIHYAHQNLIVHRDLKPSNILVTADGTPKLVDFGIAKLLDEAEIPAIGSFARPVTAPLDRRLTLEYASPEQILGNAVTTASDVYSLGVVAFELLTGERPLRLEGLTRLEMERIVQFQEPLRPSSMPAAVRHQRRLRGDLDSILLKALRKEPAERYDSVHQFSEDLLRHLRSLPVRAHRGSTWYRIRRYLVRHKVAAAFLSLALLSGGSMGVLALRLAHSVQEVTAALATAEREGRTTERVLDFLISSFELASPWGGGGEAVTVREILGRGSRRLQAELAEEPAVRAPLMDAIGTVYFQLGLLDEGEPLLEQALAIRRDLYGATHPAVAESLNNLSRLKRDAGDWQEAEALIRQALEIWQMTLGPDNPAVAEGLNNLGLLLYRRGDLEAAREPLERALEIRRSSLKPTDPKTAASFNNLGLLLYRIGEAERAETLLRQAVAIHEAGPTEDDPDLANALQNLAMVLRRRDQRDEAEEVVRRVLALQRQRVGQEHPIIADTLKNLANLLWERGAFAEAADAIREALTIHRTRFGTEHPAVAGDLNDLAALLHAAGDLEAAEPIFRQALALRRRLLPPGHPDLASSLIGLGSLLVDAGKAQAAEPLLREGRDIRKAALPEGHWRVALAESVLGGCLTSLRQFGEATVLIDDSYPIIEGWFGEEHRHSRRARERREALCKAIDCDRA